MAIKIIDPKTGKELSKYKVTYPNDNNSPEIEMMKEFSLYEKPRDQEETGLSSMIEDSWNNLSD